MQLELTHVNSKASLNSADQSDHRVVVLEILDSNAAQPGLLAGDEVRAGGIHRGVGRADGGQVQGLHVTEGVHLLKLVPCEEAPAVVHPMMHGMRRLVDRGGEPVVGSVCGWRSRLHDIRIWQICQSFKGALELVQVNGVGHVDTQPHFEALRTARGPSPPAQPPQTSSKALNSKLSTCLT